MLHTLASTYFLDLAEHKLNCDAHLTLASGTVAHCPQLPQDVVNLQVEGQPKVRDAYERRCKHRTQQQRHILCPPSPTSDPIAPPLSLERTLKEDVSASRMRTKKASTMGQVAVAMVRSDG